VLESIGRNKRSYEMAADINSGFDFDRIIPGEYLIWAYEDKDTSGKYSSGKVNPFEFSEFFNYYPDTLNLRARWPVGDIFIDFNNK
jgi:hypothetical protein